MATFIVTTGETSPHTLSTGQFGLVTATGAILTDGNSCVYVNGAGRLTVAGALSANGVNTDGVSFYNLGDSVLTVAGSGVIEGNYGVEMTEVSASYKVSNAGLISGTQVGLRIAAASAHVINAGDIHGFTSTGIFTDISGSYSIANSGEIAGSAFGVVQAGKGGCDFSNTGTVSGSLQALSLGDGDDRVVNLGLLSGSVLLAGGNDTFDGRGGVQSVVSGGDGNDQINGGVHGETLNAGGGNDILHGNGGDDLMYGGFGNDVLTGDAGDDYLTGDDGADKLAGGIGDDQLFGGAGNDVLTGNAGDDSLTGDDGADKMAGGIGDDQLSGGAGADLLQGQAGDDTLIGGLANDTLQGGDGDDQLFGQGGVDILTGGRGNDTMAGGSEVDTFVFMRNGGDDQVTDFQDGIDKLNVHVLGYSGFEQLQANAHSTATGIYIDLSYVGGGSITVDGLTMANFDASDVIL